MITCAGTRANYVVEKLEYLKSKDDDEIGSSWPAPPSFPLWRQFSQERVGSITYECTGGETAKRDLRCIVEREGDSPTETNQSIREVSGIS